MSDRTWGLKVCFTGTGVNSVVVVVASVAVVVVVATVVMLVSLTDEEDVLSDPAGELAQDVSNIAAVTAEIREILSFFIDTS